MGSTRHLVQKTDGPGEGNVSGMTAQPSDTITAISTPAGEGAIAVVRVSGPRAIEIVQAFLSGVNGATPITLQPRRSTLVTLVDEETRPFDDALVTYFPGPHSYTGEDVLELSVHGGPVPARITLEQCLRFGARMAEPGEFTLRAFLSGQIDLSQAEAVIDTIRARSRAGLRLAHRQRTGSLSRRIREIRDIAMDALVLVEATIDFPDDVDEPDRPQLSQKLNHGAKLAALRAKECRAGEVYRDGVRLVIMGKPNVGKSSLLNLLAGEDRAIVTPVPGTTRDTIEESLTLGGMPVRAIDTAGLRETVDVVERIGVDRALGSIRGADLRLLVLDRSSPLDDDDRRAIESSLGDTTVIIMNKCDLPAAWVARPGEGRLDLGGFTTPLDRWPAPPRIVEAAAGVGEGREAIETAVLEAIFGGEIIPADAIDASAARHAVALGDAARSLTHAAETAASDLPLDLISVDLHGALQALAVITGESAADSLLHEIFSRFCIGK